MSAKKSLNYKYAFNKNPYPGFFIVFEGLDGSGNSTQATRVSNELKKRGFRVLLTKEPTSGPVGAMIRMALEKRLVTDFETLQMMFTVDRADHLASKRGIVERLEKGEVVISDRFMASTIAFGYASGLDYKWLSVMQSKFFLPDKTYFLDVNPEVSLNRIRKSRPGFDLFEEKERLEKVREGYRVARKILGGSSTKVINGEQDIEKITKEIITDIEKSRKYKSTLKITQENLLEK